MDCVSLLLPLFLLDKSQFTKQLEANQVLLLRPYSAGQKPNFAAQDMVTCQSKILMAAVTLLRVGLQTVPLKKCIASIKFQKITNDLLDISLYKVAC